VHVDIAGVLPQNDALEDSSGLTQVSVEAILQAQKEQQLRQAEQDKLKNKLLLDRGFQPENMFDELHT